MVRVSEFHKRQNFINYRPIPKRFYKKNFKKIVFILV